MKKIIFLLGVILCLPLGLYSCGKPSSNTLTIGTIAGPETELVEVAQEVVKQKEGLEIKIVEFNDYNLPNEALQDGSLDANVFQHLPYLQAAIKAHHYTLEPIGKTFVYPFAVYSKKYKSITALPQHAVIAIPNDPSNESRALRLLKTAGLIDYKKNVTATVADITQNPKQLQLKELDAAQLPRVLEDVDAAVINTTFALPAGLSPFRDGIFVENKESPYANLIVINQNSAKKQQLELFVKAMHSPEVLSKAKELFGDAAIPAW